MQIKHFTAYKSIEIALEFIARVLHQTAVESTNFLR